jgi:hypothetical protein
MSATKGSDTMTTRTQLKAGRRMHHNAALKVRSDVKAGAPSMQHNEALKVRSAVKAGGAGIQHNEALKVRSAVKAGSPYANHNEPLKVRSSVKGGIVRRMTKSSSPANRLDLMVVRAGLRAGRGRK